MNWPESGLGNGAGLLIDSVTEGASLASRASSQGRFVLRRWPGRLPKIRRFRVRAKVGDIIGQTPYIGQRSRNGGEKNCPRSGKGRQEKNPGKNEETRKPGLSRKFR